MSLRFQFESLKMNFLKQSYIKSHEVDDLDQFVR